jgi:hypothetical protein
MTTTSKLGNDFRHIPKLNVSGSNWVLFKEKFFWELDARGLLEQVNGKDGEPVDLVPKTSQDTNKLSDAENELDKEWKKELKDQKRGEAIAKQQILPVLVFDGQLTQLKKN